MANTNVIDVIEEGQDRWDEGLSMVDDFELRRIKPNPQKVATMVRKLASTAGKLEALKARGEDVSDNQILGLEQVIERLVIVAITTALTN